MLLPMANHILEVILLYPSRRVALHQPVRLLVVVGLVQVVPAVRRRF